MVIRVVLFVKTKNKFRLKIDPKEDLITLGTMLALCLVSGLVINGFWFLTASYRAELRNIVLLSVGLAELALSLSA